MLSFIALLIQAPPAGAITLTYVKPLFRITHQFKYPSDVAVSRDNRIYVVDGVNNQIKVFSYEGAFLTAFGTEGAAPGQFRQPLGIDVDRSGMIYVADSGNHRVQIFDSDGRFVAQLPIPAEGNKPADPTDVAVDAARKRGYVVDNDNHRILVYDLPSRKRIDTYGRPGTNELEFRYPFLINLDRRGYLYIVDVINTRVQILNPEGLFVDYVGGWGVESGEFFRPKGVGLDQAGRIYVSDSYLEVIQIFRSNGAFDSVVGDPEVKTIIKFRTPVGVTVDHNNRLYVVEMYADHVSVYQIQ